jgi:hypothetical protein
MERSEHRHAERPMAFSRLSRLLARIETRVALGALLLALACIVAGSLIADRLVIVRLLRGAHD